eukprot:1962112-Alexandrium_andersonii.AAC.1
MPSTVLGSRTSYSRVRLRLGLSPARVVLGHRAVVARLYRPPGVVYSASRSTPTATPSACGTSSTASRS